MVENNVKNSQLWKQFKRINLKENKRIKDNVKKKWLLNIGDGKFSSTFENEHEVLELPKEILSNGNLIYEIYGNGMIFCENSVLNESISLATKNADVSELNKEILQKINEPTKVYLSVDSAKDENNENLTFKVSKLFIT